MLDFLPEGFRIGVEAGMPFRNHKVTTNPLSDSLYYSLSYLADSIETDFVSIGRGIDPAIIKTIRDKKYQNTFIAAREFEMRLKEIFLTWSEVPSLAIREFETGSDSAFRLKLSPSTPDKVRDAVKSYEEYAPENRIMKDLEYMKFFYEREQQQMREHKFIQQLRKIAFPCHGELEEERMHLLPRLPE